MTLTHRNAVKKNKRPIRSLRALCVISLITGIAHAAPKTPTEGKVHSDPAKPYPGFKPHELSFETPKDGVARTEYKSQPFYVVILKTADRCSVTEEERLNVQTMFPHNKVFATRFQCNDDVEENIDYTNVNAKYGFIAVHAGTTLAEAQALLAKAKTTGRFAGANIRKMQAVLVYP